MGLTPRPSSGQPESAARGRPRSPHPARPAAPWPRDGSAAAPPTAARHRPHPDSRRSAPPPGTPPDRPAHPRARPTAPPSASRRQSNRAPGSPLRPGAMSECAITRSGGMFQRAITCAKSRSSAAICASAKGSVPPFASSIPMEREFTSATPPQAPAPACQARASSGHQRQHLAGLGNQVVRRHLRRRIAQPLQRRPAGGHRSVVENDQVRHRPAPPLAEIRRGMRQARHCPIAARRGTGAGPRRRRSRRRPGPAPCGSRFGPPEFRNASCARSGER